MPSCSQAQCRVAESGVCLEGHKQGCPHLLPDESGVTPPSKDAASPAKEIKLTPEPRRFHTGEKLTPPEASRLLKERGACVVLCVGSQRSGKTTFLARIGEMFRDGSFSRYCFAKSLTLCGFERATWWATITSGAGRPDTKRTQRVENDTFLHLRVWARDNPYHQRDLLISDLAGETFPTAVASGEFCAGLCSLQRADHVVVFLDCARLVDPVNRHPECNNVREFLHRIIAVKHNPKALHVQVVFSRWDYVVRDKERATQERFCESIKSDLKKRFADSFATFEFAYIAARPEEIKPTNANIQSLFAYWLETPLYQPPPPVARNSQPVRDFSAFGLV